MRDLRGAAIEAIQEADFRSFWPVETRKDLVRAAKTEGEFYPYAVRIVERALRDARNIERRMAKDIEAGEAVLSQADRKRLAV